MLQKSSFISIIILLTSMINSQQTKNQLSRVINHQQRNFNNVASHRLKSSRINHSINIQDRLNLNKDLAGIQKQQIQLKKLNEADNLIKSRIEDEQNLIQITERFPFGRENVDISEDVLQRYKGNYHEQSKIIQRFRMEAQKMKKTSRVGKKKNNLQWHSPEKENNQDYLKRLKKKLKKQHDQQNNLRQLQKKAMRNIVSTLSNLSLQLHNNSYTLQKGIRQLQKKFKKQKKVQRRTVFKSSYRQLEQLQKESTKIPVVVYKQKPFDARVYFSDLYKNIRKVSKQEKINTERMQYQEIIKVLKQNERRLKYLNNYERERQKLNKYFP